LVGGKSGAGCLQSPGRTELGARPLQVLRQVGEQRLAVGYRMVELLKRDIEGGQRSLLDGAVLETLQGVPQYGVRLRLQTVEFFG